MRIAVIGAGAMGSIYGGRLSLHNEVYMVDTSAAVVDHISREGICLEEPDGVHVYRPKAVTSTEGLEPVDLIVLFVKSLYSKAALSGNPCLIGPDTYVLTLQNGCGHEDILSEFVPRERIIIGTTQDNGAALGPGHVRRGGTGHTNVGMLTGDDKRFFPRMAEAFGSCGFELEIHSDIRQLIWNKLFTNVSLSAVTAILQVDMGYITSNAHAWNMTVQLIHEAAAVARAMGLLRRLRLFPSGRPGAAPPSAPTCGTAEGARWIPSAALWCGRRRSAVWRFRPISLWWRWCTLWKSGNAGRSKERKQAAPAAHCAQ